MRLCQERVLRTQALRVQQGTVMISFLAGPFVVPWDPLGSLEAPLSPLWPLDTKKLHALAP